MNNIQSAKCSVYGVNNNKTNMNLNTLSSREPYNPPISRDVNNHYQYKTNQKPILKKSVDVVSNEDFKLQQYKKEMNSANQYIETYNKQLKAIRAGEAVVYNSGGPDLSIDKTSLKINSMGRDVDLQQMKMFKPNKVIKPTFNNDEAYPTVDREKYIKQKMIASKDAIDLYTTKGAHMVHTENASQQPTGIEHYKKISEELAFKKSRLVQKYENSTREAFIPQKNKDNIKVDLYKNKKVNSESKTENYKANSDLPNTFFSLNQKNPIVNYNYPTNTCDGTSPGVPDIYDTSTLRVSDKSSSPALLQMTRAVNDLAWENYNRLNGHRISIMDTFANPATRNRILNDPKMLFHVKAGDKFGVYGMPSCDKDNKRDDETYESPINRNINKSYDNESYDNESYNSQSEINKVDIKLPKNRVFNI